MWSFGCLLFQCRTAQILFKSVNNEQLCKQTVSLIGVPHYYQPKFFVQNTFKYFFDNQEVLTELGLTTDSPYYPS